MGSEHHQPVSARFGSPDFTWSAQKLADIGRRAGQGEDLEILLLRVFGQKSP